MQETQVQSLGGEDPLEKRMATHCSILAWRIPWTEEPGRLNNNNYIRDERLKQRPRRNSINWWRKVKESEVAQSCLTLCDPMDCSLPDSSVHGIFQARVLEWIAISFSRGSSRPGIETRSPPLQADTLPSQPPGNFMAAITICSDFGAPKNKV